jgi:uncharacterized membrane protein
MLLRFVAYGLVGWCAEIVWTAGYDALSGQSAARPGQAARLRLERHERLMLVGRTYLWMLPIYGLAALLFEPVHDALRPLPWPARGALYAAGIFAVEYAAGYLLRRAIGRCPWDYSYARASVHGYIRLDYAPVWFVFGLALERVHDVLSAVEAPLGAALARHFW